MPQSWPLCLGAWVQVSSVSTFCPGAELSVPGAGGGSVTAAAGQAASVRWLPRAKMAASSRAAPAGTWQRSHRGSLAPHAPLHPANSNNSSNIQAVSCWRISCLLRSPGAHLSLPQSLAHLHPFVGSLSSFCPWAGCAHAHGFCHHLTIFREPGPLPWGGLRGLFRLPGTVHTQAWRAGGVELVPGWVGWVRGTSGQQSLEHMLLARPCTLVLWL